MVPLVMGILNVTPDSFSDGGRYLDPDAAIAHGLELWRDGAAYVSDAAHVTEVRRLVGPHACPAVATTCVTRTGQGWADDRTRHMPAAEPANRFVLGFAWWGWVAVSRQRFAANAAGGSH